MTTRPNRWLHLRHPDGFSEQDFVQFQAHCRIWRAYTQAVLAEWTVLEPKHANVPRYVFFEPTLSEDRRVATLPVGGAWTLGSRLTFENAASHLLSDFFPLQFKLNLEEGLTETIDASKGPTTHWRRILRPIPPTPPQ